MAVRYAGVLASGKAKRPKGVLPEILNLGKWSCLRPMRWIIHQFKTSDIVAPIGERRSPQHDTSGEQLPGCHSRDVERHRSLRLLWRVIGKAEGARHDMGAGEDLAFPHQEACAHDTAIGRADPHK